MTNTCATYSPLIRTCVLLGLLAIGGSLVGCDRPGGIAWSFDRYTYESTPWQPWTVNLIDTRTQETIWSAEVPPGKQLVVAFRKGRGETDAYPDLMTWQITPQGRVFGAQANRLPVPPKSARLLSTTLRHAPEFPQTPAEVVPPPPPLAPIETPVEPVAPSEGEPAEPPAG